MLVYSINIQIHISMTIIVIKQICHITKIYFSATTPSVVWEPITLVVTRRTQTRKYQSRNCINNLWTTDNNYHMYLYYNNRTMIVCLCHERE